MKFKILFMKLMFLLMFMPMAVTAQEQGVKPKRIYITLDVSGSMEGNKYMMANYAAQSISVFSNIDDLVYIYYLGKRHDISNANGYKTIQIPYNKHSGQKSYHEISDLTQFLKDYRPDPNYQDWLFVIGDGHWDYTVAKDEYDSTTDSLKTKIDNGDFQVCYLQTGDKLSQCYAFTNFMRTFNSDEVDIRYSDTTASSVLDNCVYFANRILGFSNESIAINKDGPSCLSFASEYPLDRFLLVYQSKKQHGDNFKIESVRMGENDIHFTLKGNPSTRPLIGAGQSALNGMVWEMNYPQGIPANETIEVCFNQEVDVKEFVLYPYVDMSLLLHPYSESSDALQEFNPNQFVICDQEGGVVIKLETTDKHGNKFPPPLMQKMEVNFAVEGNTIKANYEASDTTFRAVIPMPGDTISYYAVVGSSGYFNRMTDRQIVVKKHEVCPPQNVPLIELPVQHFDAITFAKLIEGNDFGGEIDDTLFRQVSNRGVFDEQKMESDMTWLIDETSFEFKDGRLHMKHKPKSKWCECTYPDTLRYVMTLKSIEGILQGEYLYEGFKIPIVVPVDKRVWVMRCKNYLIVGISLFLFILYLVALLKKKRFKKNAMIIPSYYRSSMGKKVLDQQSGSRLRKPGIGAWLNRWFNPFTVEQYTNKWTAPRTNPITFVASSSKEEVLMTKSSFGTNMSMAGYNPKNMDNGVNLIPVNGRITIYTDSKKLKESGYLTYSSGNADDEGGFRFMVILLLLVSFAAEAWVLFTLIRSVL